MTGPNLCVNIPHICHLWFATIFLATVTLVALPEVATLSLIVTGHIITRPGLESENNANDAFMYVCDG